MAKGLRLILLALLIVCPIVFYGSMNKKDNRPDSVLSLTGKDKECDRKPVIALIFDDFGENLKDLKEVHSLGIPLTIAVIPHLKFSKNIAHIGSRCGYSVLIHLPLEPANNNFKTDKYRFINSKLSKNEIAFLLRRYLNSIRVAVGVNNHMGSQATQDPALMKIVMSEVKKRNLIFIDSKTSPKSVAYETAKKEGVDCGYNEGFLDAVDDVSEIEKQMEKLMKAAKDKEKIIIIAHPRKNTIDFLKSAVPDIKDKVEFITIKDYFEL